MLAHRPPDVVRHRSRGFSGLLRGGPGVPSVALLCQPYDALAGPSLPKTYWKETPHLRHWALGEGKSRLDPKINDFRPAPARILK